ncbi:MAG: FAD-dependent oxidoreductase, partial [Acidimicrobiia bacterium]|nr:FAD-dependent oxidoreductase [Acidimicrobiia bacterium]
MSSNRPALSSGSRQDDLDRLEGERFDLVIVGGGITGAGVARDAAHRGLRVALVEANDFAAGTSSRSSKLIHGGLRYLAQGEVGLVRETALERKAVHRMAPHLAEPCWMVVAARNRASLMKFRAGIGTYEKLGAVDDVDRHRVWDRDALADEEPLLRVDDYPWACAYREYLSDDARLVLAVLRDAVRAGAVMANHLAVTGLVTTDERVTGVGAECALSGRRVTISGQVVVNAAGPWVEALAQWEQPGLANRLHL